MITIGSVLEYEKLIEDDYGDDAKRLRRALAYCIKHKEILQNRCTAYKQDRERVPRRLAPEKK